MSVWVAFGAGVFLGSFLAMFTLALFLVGSEGSREGRGVAAPQDSHESSDVIPIRPAIERRAAGVAWR